MNGDIELATRDEQAELEELLRRFLRTGKSSKASHNTAEARARDLGIPLDWVPGREGRPAGRGAQHNALAWLPWCAARRLRITEIQPHHVEQWLHDLVEVEFSNATRARMLATVSRFYRFLMRPDIARASSNPAGPEMIDRGAHHLNKSGTQPPRTRGIDFGQQRGLLEAAWLLAPHNPNGLRDRAMVEVLVTTGIREDELVGANMDDYHRPYPGGPGTLRVHGKGEKDRMVLLTEPVCDAIADYLAVRSAPTAPARAGQVSAARVRPLFVSSAGHRVHSSHVQRLLRRIVASFAPDQPAHQKWLRELRAGVRAGELARVLTPLVNVIHPHQLRRGYATTASKQGVDPRQIQIDLGHENLETTVIYIDSGRGVEDSAAREISPSLHRGWWTPRNNDEAAAAQRHTEVAGQMTIDEETP